MLAVKLLSCLRSTIHLPVHLKLKIGQILVTWEYEAITGVLFSHQAPKEVRGLPPDATPPRIIHNGRRWPTLCTDWRFLAPAPTPEPWQPSRRPPDITAFQVPHFYEKLLQEERVHSHLGDASSDAQRSRPVHASISASSGHMSMTSFCLNRPPNGSGRWRITPRFWLQLRARQANSFLEVTWKRIYIYELSLVIMYVYLSDAFIFGNKLNRTWTNCIGIWFNSGILGTRSAFWLLRYRSHIKMLVEEKAQVLLLKNISISLSAKNMRNIVLHSLFTVKTGNKGGYLDGRGVTLLWIVMNRKPLLTSC